MSVSDRLSAPERERIVPGDSEPERERIVPGDSELACLRRDVDESQTAWKYRNTGRRICTLQGRRVSAIW